MEGEAKTLIWDIETSPMISYNWGAYESNALEIIQEPTILCFAYKWLGDKNVRVIGQDDFKGYKPGVLNDKQVVKKIHELFEEADIVVAHNGDSFDQKTANSRMIVHGMNPPAPYKQIDTKKEAKRIGRFSRNKLDDLCGQFGFGHKMEHEGWAMWRKVLMGEKKAWKMMKDYNKIDVELEEKLYLRLRPWMKSHPNMALLNDMPDTCPKCNGENFRKGGYTFSNVGKRKRYQCKDCGTWVSGRVTLNSDVKYVNQV